MVVSIQDLETSTTIFYLQGIPFCQDIFSKEMNRLERRLGVLDERNEVVLVPGTSLGRGLVRIVLAAVAVVAGSGGVGGTIRLTTGLNPDESISERVAGAGGWADTETGTGNVAPVTPLLAEVGDTVAAGIHDSLGWHTGALELGRKELDVCLLVLSLVPLGVGGLGELSRIHIPLVPAGNVGGESTDLLGRARVLVDGRKLLSSGL